MIYSILLTNIGINLIPKGLNVRTAHKPIFGSITSSHFIFRFFGTFYEHAPQNKLCGSINFIIFGPMDQKLWMCENSMRSLGRVGMCRSQRTRVDHVCKNMSAGRRKKILQGV
jgi:hypothetical protein